MNRDTTYAGGDIYSSIAAGPVHNATLALRRGPCSYQITRTKNTAAKTQVFQNPPRRDPPQCRLEPGNDWQHPPGVGTPNMVTAALSAAACSCKIVAPPTASAQLHWLHHSLRGAFTQPPGIMLALRPRLDVRGTPAAAYEDMSCEVAAWTWTLRGRRHFPSVGRWGSNAEAHPWGELKTTDLNPLKSALALS